MGKEHSQNGSARQLGLRSQGPERTGDLPRATHFESVHSMGAKFFRDKRRSQMKGDTQFNDISEVR